MPAQLLRSMDYLNAVHGGRGETTYEVDKYEDHYDLIIRLPGISREDVAVEINNNMLNVFHSVALGEHTGQVKDRLPFMIYSAPIPVEVNYDEIIAYHEGNLLKIELPLNNLSRGFNKSVEIISR
jgi:HSP20 family molecular chaperone IbpA